MSLIGLHVTEVSTVFEEKEMKDMGNGDPSLPRDTTNQKDSAVASPSQAVSSNLVGDLLCCSFLLVFCGVTADRWPTHTHTHPCTNMPLR